VAAYNPNPDSALNSACTNRDLTSRRQTVQISMRGLLSSTPTPYCQPDQPPVELEDDLSPLHEFLLQHYWADKPASWTYKPTRNGVVDLLIRNGANFKKNHRRDQEFPMLQLQLFKFRLFSRLGLLTASNQQTPPRKIPFLGALQAITDDFPLVGSAIDLVVLEADLPDRFQISTPEGYFQLLNGRAFLESYLTETPLVRNFSWECGAAQKTVYGFEALCWLAWEVCAFLRPGQVLGG